MPRRSQFLKACAAPACPQLTRGRFCPMHQHTEDRKHSVATAFYRTPAWRALRALVLQSHPFCACGARAMEVDHVIGRNQGGTDELSNLASMCKPCHSRKGAAKGERWGSGAKYR